MQHRSRLMCVLLLVLVFVVPALVRADVTGSILGIVHDPTSAVIAGVEITVTNVETNQSLSTQSDATGEYRFLALPTGNYRLEATSTGFQKFLATGIELTVNEQRRLDITLQIGSVEQEVQVNATAIQVETTNTQLGEVIDQRKVQSLPLNGRSYIDLLGLQAGVAPTTVGSMQQDRPVSGDLSAGNISVNGQRETANAFLVNGGDVTEGRNLGTAVIPNLDSVAEFRLLTNSFDAEYGKFSGAVMNAVTKSGTNGFHGDVFEFLRNDKLDSRGFFDTSRAVFRRNEFGYAVGGPIWKNKIFWFTDYQGNRETVGISSGLVQVPTVAERGGDFSAVGGLTGSVNGPYWAQVLSNRLGYGVSNGEHYGGCTVPGNCVFPGNVVPQRAFAPPTLPTMKYIPLPNFGNNLFSTAGQNETVRDDKAGQRVDINNQTTGNWYIYYFFDDTTLVNPFGGANVPGFPTVTPQRAQQVVLSNTKILGPGTVNEARVSFLRAAVVTNKPTAGFAKLSDLGFVENQGLGIFPSGPPGFEGLPPLSFGQIGLNVGTNTLTTTQPDNTWALSETLSKIVGRHTLKMGGEFRYFQINERNVCGPNGSFNFDGSETGNDFADYLVGAPVGYTQCSMQFLDSRGKYGGAFFQDSFRLKPNITLNYGLRWEVSTPWYDTQNKIETLVLGEQSVVFPTAPKGWVVPGDPGIPNTLSPTRHNNFAPRLGMAYSPGFSDGALGKIFGGPGKTSIRAAFGIYYTSIEDLNLFYEVGDAPYGLYWPSIVPPLFELPFQDRGDGKSQTQRFPFVFPIPGSPANKTLNYAVYLPIQGSPGYDPHNKLPYAEHYNFSIQRTLTPATLLTFAYVGTQGHQLIAQRESNPGNPQLCLSLMGAGVMPGTQQCGPGLELGTFTRPDGTIVNGTRGPFGPNFGSNAYTSNIANSNYNALEITVERKAADVTFLAAYTYSKAMDDSSAYGESVNFSNYRLSRALSQYDLTHNFVFSYNWSLPFDKAGALPKRLTQGWNLIGITRFASGFPIGIGQSGDHSLIGTGGVDEPNFIGGLKIQDPRQAAADGSGPNGYFNRSAFTSEVLGTFGDANRRFFHGPGINNFDLSLHKTTKIRENMAVEFRAEFFNAFNHAQFNNPNGNYSSPQFGLVTSAKAPRIGQLALKFLW
jgi:hypothetical protein